MRVHWIIPCLVANFPKILLSTLQNSKASNSKKVILKILSALTILLSQLLYQSRRNILLKQKSNQTSSNLFKPLQTPSNVFKSLRNILQLSFTLQKPQKRGYRNPYPKTFLSKRWPTSKKLSKKFMLRLGKRWQAPDDTDGTSFGGRAFFPRRFSAAIKPAGGFNAACLR